MYEAPGAGKQRHEPIHRDALSHNLNYVFTLHGLEAHQELRLFSLAELKRLCGVGQNLFDELVGYYAGVSITPRGNEEPFATRAKEVYGDIRAVPVAVVLSVVFHRPAVKKAIFAVIRPAVLDTGATTVGELCGILAKTLQIPGLSPDQHMALYTWFRDNGLVW